MKKLHLSGHDRWIAGVAGGLAETYSIDPLIVRVLWIATTIVAAPAAIVAYVVLWFSLKNNVEESGSSAVRIAEERYARGEIDAEQLRQIKRDLGAG